MRRDTDALSLSDILDSVSLSPSTIPIDEPVRREAYLIGYGHAVRHCRTIVRAFAGHAGAVEHHVVEMTTVPYECSERECEHWETGDGSACPRSVWKVCQECTALNREYHEGPAITPGECWLVDGEDDACDCGCRESLPSAGDGERLVARVAKALTGLTDTEWEIATAEGVVHLDSYFAVARRMVSALNGLEPLGPSDARVEAAWSEFKNPSHQSDREALIAAIHTLHIKAAAVAKAGSEGNA